MHTIRKKSRRVVTDEYPTLNGKARLLGLDRCTLHHYWTVILIFNNIFNNNQRVNRFDIYRHVPIVLCILLNLETRF